MQRGVQRHHWLAAGALLVGALLFLSSGRAWFSGDYRATTRELLEAAPARPKIWAHRVNSIGALHEAKALFAGVEADLVFNRATKSFDVRHPPQPGTGLSLDLYLAQTADRPQLRLWLDWKNPTPDNLSDALSELARLDAKYQIRGRALVETPSDATFAGISAVSEQRFLHGYYLPTERALEAQRDGPQAAAQLGEEVRTTIVRGKFGAITYDARLKPFVDRQLSGFLTQRRLRRFSWDSRINGGGAATDPASLSDTARTRDLDALLISFPSRYRV